MESEVTHAHDQYYSMVKQGDETKLSALPQFPINDQFSLNQDEAWYTLAIETQVSSLLSYYEPWTESLCQVPLDFVILQSNVPVDLQEVDKSSAVISYTQPDTEVYIYNYIFINYDLGLFDISPNRMTITC